MKKHKNTKYIRFIFKKMNNKNELFTTPIVFFIFYFF